MSLPDEIKRLQRIYRECREYRDQGHIEQQINNSMLLKWSADFSTNFHRHKSLLFTGTTHGPNAPLVSAGSSFSPVPTVGKWKLEYNNQDFNFQTGLDATSLGPAKTATELSKQATSASLGAINIIPFLLLGDSNFEDFWKPLSALDFTVDTDVSGSTTCFGKAQNVSVNLSIDSDGKLLHVRWTERSEVEPEHLRVLKESLEYFEQPQSLAALKTQKTIEILNSSKTISETVTTCRFTDSFVLS